jgi:hypothetical protein
MMITGQQIHEAYNAVVEQDAEYIEERKRQITVRVTRWDDTSDHSQLLYNRMAEILNKMLEEQEAQTS